VTPEEAERYWQILPSAQAENVVPMARDRPEGDSFERWSDTLDRNPGPPDRSVKIIKHRGIVMPRPETGVPGRDLHVARVLTCKQFFFVLWSISRSPCLKESSFALRFSSRPTHFPDSASELGESSPRRAVAFRAACLLIWHTSIRLKSAPIFAPVLFRQRREHRNHNVFERSGGIQPLLLIGNVTHAF
jgi:hypothetical protein